MKINFFVIIFILLIISSCKKKEECYNTIQYNLVENIEYGCEYLIKLSEDTTIRFEFIEINDFRSYGLECMSSTGGFAEIFFKLYHLERGNFFLEKSV